MFKAPDMRACDYTCLLCGSKLNLELENLCVGGNRGECPLCAEPFCITITTGEMTELVEAEKKAGSMAEH